MRFLDMVGGHLILIGARARVAAAPAVPRQELPRGRRVHRLRQPADRAARRRVHRHGAVAAVGLRVPPVRLRVVLGRRRPARRSSIELGAGADVADARRARRRRHRDRARHDADLRADRRARVDGGQPGPVPRAAAPDRRDDRHADPDAAVLRDRDGRRVLRRGGRRGRRRRGSGSRSCAIWSPRPTCCRG